MANSSYVRTPQLFYRQVDSLLKTVVKLLFKDQFFVVGFTQADEFREGQSVTAWAVTMSDSAILDHTEAMKRAKAAGEPFGFSVYYHHGDRQLEFRHPFNGWEWWVQQRVQHAIAELFDSDIQDDSQEEHLKANLAQFKDSYIAYLARRYKRPLNVDDMRRLQDQLAYMPPGKEDTMAML
jgi:hypothetical protein